LGWAEICHPYHPFKGQRFAVLKTRRIAGIDTLMLRHPERGSFSIAREWTNWGTPSGSGALRASRVDIERLADLVSLLEQLAAPSINNS
jgi:hypothetical protein